MGRGSDAEPPAWARELLESAQKASRAQARYGIRLEDLERKLEGGLEDLRQLLRERHSSLVRESFDELLDAQDSLEEAKRVAEACGDSALARGLDGVQRRIDAFLERHSVKRLAPLGGSPDPERFRIVGNAADPLLPDGVVARVVRAAALQGERLIREGEVLTNRRPA